MTLGELNIFRKELGYSESSGNYNNDLGEYWGKYQFGNARRIDIEKILGLHHLTREEFTPAMQEQFFNAHFNDYEKRIFADGLDRYFGVAVTGKKNKVTAKINKYGLIAGAHLGGYSGMTQYLTTNGAYDPNDWFIVKGIKKPGNHISDYVAKFSANMEKKTLHLT